MPTNDLAHKPDEQTDGSIGEGNFSVRVPAKGTDEIASLARGFNQAAQKIEQLIDANNLLLAHASHELRTPITRIRLQIEMMEMLASEMSEETQAKFHKRAQAVNRDLTGLNDLVESILLVSRLDAGHAAQTNERFDFYELISQECQHYPEATLYGKSLVIEGQPKLLIHLIRNLLNNALIHGEPPIEVHLYGVVEQEEALYPPKQLLDQIALAKSEQHTTEAQPLSLEDNSADSKSDTLTESLDETELTPDSDTKPTDSVGLGDLGPKAAQQTTPDQGQDSDKKQDKINNKAKSDSSKLNDIGFTKRLRRTKAEPVIEPNFAVLAVIDQGKGIPLDKRDEIFSPFVRLQQQRKGSGLGLSLVAQIVEAHNGRIRTDTYNGRTRFIVLLPINDSVTVEKPSFS